MLLSMATPRHVRPGSALRDPSIGKTCLAPQAAPHRGNQWQPGFREASATHWHALLALTAASGHSSIRRAGLA